MGCGSSSLKGDSPTGVGGDSSDPAPRPVKKVATNFSTVDYDNTDNKKRRNTEYAPHETAAQESNIEEVVAHANNGVEQPKDETVEPYHDPDSPTAQRETVPTRLSDMIDERNGVNHDANAGADPLSAQSKDKFAEQNAPAHNTSTGTDYEGSTLAPDSIPPGGAGEKKSSMFGKAYKKYSDSRDGRNTNISEDDMKKYTGKSKEEMTRYMQEGEGVGGGQGANARDSAGPGAGLLGMSGYGAGGGSGG